MVDIIQLRRNHYTGLDADKASVTGVIGDSYAATDKDKQYYWTAGGWKTGLGYEYVPRTTNVADFAVGDLVTDGTWKVDGLDLSGIVPVGAVAVAMEVYVIDNLTAQLFTVRKDATHTSNRFFLNTQVANIGIAASGIIVINADRLLDYYGQNTVWATINITVLGWFI